MPYQKLIEFYESQKDPVREFFQEKLQMLFSSSHTSAILRKAQEGKRSTLDKVETVQSLVERKEMRVKKLDFESKMHSGDVTDKEKEIKSLLEQHQKVDSKIIDHYRRETSQQEDQFQRKMRERKDRSVERSLSRSVDIGTRKREGGKAFKEIQSSAIQNPKDWKGIESQIVPEAVLSQRDTNVQPAKETVPEITKTPIGRTESVEASGALGNVLTDSVVNPTDKMDAFSHKKISALQAKMSKMKMFDEEFAAQMGADGKM